MIDDNSIIDAGVGAFEGPIKQSVNSVFNAINRGVESIDLFGKYETAQRDLIRSTLQNIKLLGMESPVPLQDIYYPAHVSTSVSRRLYEQEWLSEKTQNGPKRAVPKKPSRRQGDSIRGDAFVEKTRKVVILGGPGAGKTTFLKFLALAHSDETLFKNSDLKTKLVPFFIHLPKLSKTGLGILEFLAAPLCDKTTEYGLDFVKREMNKGGVLLLLDSLDEVPVAQRQELISKIRYFESIYPKVRILVSCRTADYEEVLENFTEVELARLSDDAIKKIVSAWFIADPEKANRLLSLIASDEGVASLTETPLLLSLLCIQFRHDLQLPKRKVELYRRCILTRQSNRFIRQHIGFSDV